MFTEQEKQIHKINQSYIAELTSNFQKYKNQTMVVYVNDQWCLFPKSPDGSKEINKFIVSETEGKVFSSHEELQKFVFDIFIYNYAYPYKEKISIEPISNSLISTYPNMGATDEEYEEYKLKEKNETLLLMKNMGLITKLKRDERVIPHFFKFDKEKNNWQVLGILNYHQVIRYLSFFDGENSIKQAKVKFANMTFKEKLEVEQKVVEFLKTGKLLHNKKIINLEDKFRPSKKDKYEGWHKLAKSL
ncbi:unnamed protein product [Candida verbasci]|uniref:Uncharacterized protein n=1 Tax=Candida verbasci TaxID=1227364 RepID=A0A9W4U0E7_9ASCO|nr:unnamed protein product [Candida verbasci]